MRAHFAYGRVGPRPMSDIPYSTRRWTGLSPSRTSGSARGSMLPPPMIPVPAITRPPHSRCAPASDVDLRGERVVFDEPPAELHDLAHEAREQLFGLGG